jgi:hypothetical protein
MSHENTFATQEKFTAGHPLSAEQAQQLGDLFTNKIVDLSRQPELDFHEKSFIDTVVDSSAQSLDYLINERQMKMPLQAAKRVYITGWPLAEEAGIKLVKPELNDVLKAVADNDTGIRGRGYMRLHAEDFAKEAVTALASVVESNGGHLILDQRLAVSMNEMLASYEKTEH